MNIFTGKISSIKVSGNMSLVGVSVGDAYIKGIVIETPATAAYLQEGKEIRVMFKETEVVIGKGVEHLVSLQNRLSGPITEIENGGLLSKIVIDSIVGNVVAVVTIDAVNQLQLKEGDLVTAMIKTNEIMLSA